MSVLPSMIDRNAHCNTCNDAKCLYKQCNISTSIYNMKWVQFNSVSESCLTPGLDRSTPGFPVHHQLPWFAQIHVHWVGEVMSNSSRPHGLQPTSLLHPWDFPGKSTGVSYHCHLRKRSLVLPILLFSSISLHWSVRKGFLSLLAILWNSAFKWTYLSFSPLLFTFLVTVICKAPQPAVSLFCFTLSWG